MFCTGQWSRSKLFNSSSLKEVAESVAIIGCNTTTRKFITEGGRLTHEFPVSPLTLIVAFEITGMLARTLHIESSAFPTLPNPTQQRWNLSTFSPLSLIEAYATQIQEAALRATNAAIELSRDLPEKRQCSPGPVIGFMNKLHEVVLDMTGIITAKARAKRQRQGLISVPLLPRSYSNRPRSWREKRENSRRALVLLVLRNRIQEVISSLNKGLEHNAHSNPIMTTSDASEQAPTDTTLWSEVDKAPHGVRELKFMEVYFQIIRPQVIEEADRWSQQVGNTAPSSYFNEASKQPASQPALRPTNQTQYDRSIPLWCLDDDDLSFDDIWCAFVFRSICWLTLHDFNKNDVQIPKSDLYGSQMPVYIE
ncbi:modin-like protein [Colletotrichum incanum]|nr:modin-like protein [Colletotrichum incanum]